MLNIFVTYRCNLACPYCFAADMKAEFPQDMSPEAYGRLLRWMSHEPPPAVAFIGGEPTLHPHLLEMIEDAVDSGIAAILFTNGLFRETVTDDLAALVSNFVVNYNDPALYTKAQSRLLHANLDRLHKLGARITFSKNFSGTYSDYGYLLEGIDRYDVQNVRYDISRPTPGGLNDHFTLDEGRRILAHAVGFVRACEERGVRTGLDCSVRLCDLKDEDRRYLERVSMKFGGVCHPSMDVHPDLSASYCLPMRHLAVPDITRLAGVSALRTRLAELARPIRYANAQSECADCAEFMRRCQGGCMALTSRETPLCDGAATAIGADIS